ncbi:MAG: hypothetical protein DWI06_03155 [Planctomycetota bacterium]|nr:MAG: hypothetical protein DWH95_06690 [Planctomycetota bacterium]RLS84672.1 MAG: hypothetical protein DWI06_03155 [Planctomycetota bacterium]
MIHYLKSSLIALSIPLLMTGCGNDREKGMNKDKGFPRTESPKVEKKKAPETKAPETKAPETKAPETKAPETKAPETK